MNRRVVITGMGALTPIGNTAQEFWQNTKNGVVGIDFITKFDTTNFKVKIAGEVKNLNTDLYIEKKETKRMDLFSTYAVVAAVQAVRDSKIDLETIDKDRFGVFVGTGIGGLGMIEEQVVKIAEKGPNRVAPLFIPSAIVNMAAGNVAIKFGAAGVCSCVVTACATGTNSIGEAFRSIKFGFSDICLAGGTEASITSSGTAGFTNLTALSETNEPLRSSIPFDLERTGFVMGEGAGIVFLEEMESAIKRGAHIYGEVVGYGTNCDAYHITSPMPGGEGASKAMELAMKEAGISPEEVSYINAHGTSTKPNDKTETIAIKRTFGEHAKNLYVSSTKSMTGHLLGAAGAVEAIASIMALEDGFAPPTAGLKVPDPECDLNYVPNVGVSANMKYAISNSFGFGGHNAVLCFKKWEA